MPETPRARPFLFGPRADFAVFGGTTVLALVLAFLAPRLADPDGSLPAWGFLLFVVAVDVAHVHTTLFRTYFDAEELGRRRLLYLGVPLACWAAGVLLHAVSRTAFWRTLAYVAVFHFVRQQIGWVAIYQARAGESSRWEKRLDEAVVYAAAGFPLATWHARLPRSFRWFVEGDFVPLAWLGPWIPWLGLVYAALLVAYVGRALLQATKGHSQNVGKHLVVASTVSTWYIGIVATDSDFAFTACNVLVHGVPYTALLFVYARSRAREAPRILGARIVSLGAAGFFGTALALAFVEELAWGRLVWGDAPGLFGTPDGQPLLGPAAMTLVVPLLAVPQATHYVLDAFLWRRRDTGRAQAQALGFSPARLAR